MAVIKRASSTLMALLAGIAGLAVVAALILAETPLQQALLIASLIGFGTFSYIAIALLEGIDAARHAAEKEALALREMLARQAAEQQELVTAEKLSALSRFASVTSHELKNPLASLKNIAYFLTKVIKTDDEKTKHMLEMMSGEIDRTDALINNLSDLSRMRRISKMQVQVDELVEETLAALKLPPSITLLKEVSRVEAMVDPEKVKTVLVNLVTNARDAMPNGGQLSVHLSGDGDSLSLVVSDTGCGMDAETLKRAFEPLFTTKTKVLGMGLTVVKEIVSAHNGQVTAESEKGRGSLFTVRLPRAGVGAGNTPAA